MLDFQKSAPACVGRSRRLSGCVPAHPRKDVPRDGRAQWLRLAEERVQRVVPLQRAVSRGRRRHLAEPLGRLARRLAQHQLAVGEEAEEGAGQAGEGRLTGGACAEMRPAKRL